MLEVSLCMIVKNEEEVLERCLASIYDIMQEIIIVDTGSTDNTKEIALRYTNNVYDFKWCDDFSKARNFAFSKARCPYAMWLDADDIILQEDHQKLKSLLETNRQDFDILMLKYHTAFDDFHHPTFTYYRERIVKNDGNNLFSGVVHEAIIPHGTILYEDIAVTHKKMHIGHSRRNLHILKKQKIKNGLSPREQYYYARELYFHRQYQEAIEEFTCFLNDGKGWVENCIDACRIRGHCFQALNKEKEAFSSYLESFYYKAPRSEILCDIAYHFFCKERYQEAIFWYELAARQTPDETTGAFIEKDCYGYIPYLQLCVCYDRLHDRQKAIYYNELAGYLKPGSKTYRFNKDYFKRQEGAV